MKTCPDCGERVYRLGCINCNEPAYIDQQIALTERYGEDDPRHQPSQSKPAASPERRHE